MSKLVFEKIGKSVTMDRIPPKWDIANGIDAMQGLLEVFDAEYDLVTTQAIANAAETGWKDFQNFNTGVQWFDLEIEDDKGEPYTLSAFMYSEPKDRKVTLYYSNPKFPEERELFEVLIEKIQKVLGPSSPKVSNGKTYHTWKL